MLPPNPDETLLLHLNEAIATIRDKETLFRVITNKLRLIFPFDLIGINVFDKELVNKRLFLRSYVGGAAEALPIDASATIFSPIAGSPVEQLIADPRLRNITLEEYAAEYPDFEPFNKLRRQGIHYMTTVPLRLGGRLTGFLILAAARRPALTEADEHLLLSIGSLVAVAVGNTLGARVSAPCNWPSPMPCSASSSASRCFGPWPKS
jgi:formate hydrogenlyase transcriptional activator